MGHSNTAPKLLRHFFISSKKKGRSKVKVIISILSGLLLAFSANAATVTVDANALGGYIQAFSGGSVVSGSGNYSVGEVSDFFGANVEVRNYAVFDLSAVGGTVTAATVRYFNPVNGFSSPYDPEAFGLSDVTTSIATLTSGAGGAAAFADLGSGIGLGGTFAGASTNGVFVNVPLNASGVAYVNSKLGGDAAFGGRLGALNDAFAEDRGFFLGSSLPLSNVQLVLEVVPIPAAFWLFGGALTLLGFARRRRDT